MKIFKIYIPKEIIIVLSLAVVLNLARVLFFNSTYFVFLLWNIFLAVLPFIISSVLLFYYKNSKLTNFIFIFGLFVWLLFVPNAPYLVTDLIHVGRGRGVPIIYDTFLIFSSAWIGILLFFYSLSHIEKIFISKFPKRNTSIVITGVILLISFGIYLGRFLRFNSWDIVANTEKLLNDIGSILVKPIENKDAYIFMSLTFVFIYVSYMAWKAIKDDRRDDINQSA